MSILIRVIWIRDDIAKITRDEISGPAKKKNPKYLPLVYDTQYKW